jgi:hypothetical protein
MTTPGPLNPLPDIGPRPPMRLLIDEHIRADSRLVRTWLALQPGDKVAIEVGLDREPAEIIAALSAGAVAHVLRHYGRALDEAVVPALEGADRLALAPGLEVARLRWRAAVDADGRDWLVLIAAGAEPVAALAPGVAAALRFIAAGRAQP